MPLPPDRYRYVSSLASQREFLVWQAGDLSEIRLLVLVGDSMPTWVLVDSDDPLNWNEDRIAVFIEQGVRYADWLIGKAEI